MDIIEATILEKDIGNTLWAEIVLAIIHIKNLQPIQALKDLISPIKIQD